MSKYLFIFLLIASPSILKAGEVTQTAQLQSLLSTVAKEIDFEPYPGNLRSIKFVEETGKANAFDRSLLLLNRIKAAGFRGHVARGELKEEHKQALLKRLFNKLDSTTVSVADQSLEQTLSTHYWVEVLLDNKLVPMDASFSEAKLDESFAVKKGVVTSLDQYQYKFKFVHKLKNASGSTIVMGRYSTTTSLQDVKPITLVTTAEPIVGQLERRTSLMGGGLSGIAGGVAGRNADPSKKGGEEIGKNYVTRLLQDDKSRKFGFYKATNNIEGAAIEKEWLEITLHYPGQKPFVIERVLFEAKPGVEAPDYRQVTINLLPGSVPLEFKNRYVKSAARDLPDKKSVVNSTDLSFLKSTNAKLGPRLGSAINLSIAALSDSETVAIAQRNGLVSVFDKPRIYITELAGKQDTSNKSFDFTLSFDYRLDEISAYTNQSDGEARKYYFLIARGLQQSAIEGAMLAKVQESKSFSTVDIMLQASEHSIEKYVVTANNLQEIDILESLSDPLKNKIIKEIESGLHVIIPKSKVVIDQTNYLAWWLVNPDTGSTQGVLESGLNGAVVEYTISQRELAVNDQRGFVFGMLAGANLTQMTILTNMLAGVPLDSATVAEIEKKLQALACQTCVNPEASFELTWSVSGKIGCFELYKIIITDKSKALGLSFCGAYSAGFNCAVKMVLGKIDGQPSMEINDPISVSTSLSCPSQ